MLALHQQLDDMPPHVQRKRLQEFAVEADYLLLIRRLGIDQIVVVIELLRRKAMTFRRLLDFNQCIHAKARGGRHSGSGSGQPLFFSTITVAQYISQLFVSNLTFPSESVCHSSSDCILSVLRTCTDLGRDSAACKQPKAMGGSHRVLHVTSKIRDNRDNALAWDKASRCHCNISTAGLISLRPQKRQYCHLERRSEQRD